MYVVEKSTLTSFFPLCSWLFLWKKENFFEIYVTFIFHSYKLLGKFWQNKDGNALNTGYVLMYQIWFSKR